MHVCMQRPECKYPTVLDMLDVEDPNILNVLIDQLNVESILLIQSREEASRVIVHHRPKKARSAYTVDGDQVLQYAHYSNKQGKFGILRESVEAAVRDEQERLGRQKKGVADLQQELRDLQEKVDVNKRYVGDAGRKIKRKTTEKWTIKSEIEKLQNAEEEEEPEEDIATYVSPRISRYCQSTIPVNALSKNI